MPAPTSTSSRLNTRSSLLLGSLMFGLFFGAGNLIFPISLGLQSGTHVWWAAIGFLITAVGLPIIGVIASATSRTSSLLELASRVGPRFGLVFTAALYLTIGPFFAIPRTATVTYEMAFGETFDAGTGRVALLVFSAVFFGLVLLASMRPGKLMDYVGKFLTPTFLVLLILLLVVALARLSGADLPEPTATYANTPAITGAFDGYNTMDALAGLAFAIVLIEAVRGFGITSRRRIAIELTRSGVVAAVAMGAIYAALAVLGAYSNAIVDRGANGAVAFAGIASHNFGAIGHVLASLIMLAACIKTAIGLASACVEMFSEMPPRFLGKRGWAIVFAGLSFALANVGLETIIGAAVPVLQLLYPLAIVLILLGLLDRVVRGNRLAHVLPVLAAGIVAVLALVASLPASVPALPHIARTLGGVLPGFELGIGWILPAAVGLAIGVLVGRPRTDTDGPTAPESLASLDR